ncbi:hypothetical protein OCGS_0185 [Oceaniovalibus guishaninsula JLT2003]|uniref:Glycosyltransferase RgtA/B/C/D-like domain-containing protein n=1 Tax=Oceaniovalibus guishaninsula JLT2003 TaxID=1231392 RepID=K2HE24_9RHOB|nr:hypothetical protein [Oceaniovalibus guishaninsula]EKE45713.1 hypothetical protein OCGS_0185 [Oceaniovalibus guishaninsula JLT2003]
MDRSGGLAHLAGICALTLALMWPAFWTGAPLAFSDSRSYYVGGGVAVEFFVDKVTALLAPAGGTATDGPPPAPGAAAEAFEPSHQVANVRSVPYSVAVNLAVRAAGLWAPVAIVSFLTAWLIWTALAPLGVVARAALGMATAGITTVAFYSAQVMPDIFAAWLILIPIVVVRRDGRPGLWTGIALWICAFGGAVFHYSHIPLAATMGVALGAWYLWRRRPIAALAVQTPLLLAMAVNVAISGALPGGKPSLAPARLPILLARSLADGVAVRYLTENCDTAPFTICTLYDAFPTTVAKALWDEGNIRDRATKAQMAQISAEEVALVWQVFLYDPGAQLWALLGNGAEQMVRFGLGDVRVAEWRIDGPAAMETTFADPPAFFDGMEGVQILSVSLGALALAALVLAMPASRLPVALLVLGLTTNAFVCGGLSAPADRYQGRVIWLVVLLALLLGAEWRARRKGRYL